MYSRFFIGASNGNLQRQTKLETGGILGNII